MDSARVKAELTQIIAMASRLKELLEADEGELAAPHDYMSIYAYAKRAQVSDKTLRKWIKAGLPVRRRGKTIRVVVAEADEWTADAAALKSAEMTAHGAKT